MSLMEKRVLENRNRRKREEFISQCSDKLSDFISVAPFSSDIELIKFAAFSTWDMERNVQTSTRGDIENWKAFDFPEWKNLILAIKALKSKQDISGYFFTDTDGPYYEMSLWKFLQFIDEISEFAVSYESYDFAWIGYEKDCGIIAEFDHTSMCRNEFELALWNIEVD